MLFLSLIFYSIYFIFIFIKIWTKLFLNLNIQNKEVIANKAKWIRTTNKSKSLNV